MTFAEEHRPETFDEIVGQPVDAIEQRLNGSGTPNFLFYGPPGTGKTTTARLIAHEVTEMEPFELNASDDRGINTVRDRITQVSRTATLSGNPPVIILDEFDQMTADAQQALRGPMEDHPAIFVLTANDVRPIRSPIRSRCYQGGIEFGPVEKDAIVSRLASVAHEEGMSVRNDDLHRMAEEADGDLRAALIRLGDQE